MRELIGLYDNCDAGFMELNKNFNSPNSPKIIFFNKVIGIVMKNLLPAAAFLFQSFLLSIGIFGIDLFCQNGLAQGDNQPHAYIRIHDNVLRQGITSNVYVNNNAQNFFTTDSICNLASTAKHGQIAPGTGGG